MDRVDICDYFDEDCNDSYHLAKPLHFTGAVPKTITLDELCHLLLAKRVIFYTGAGISANAGVSTMAGLKASLGLNQQVVDNLTRAVLREGDKSLLPWKSFCESMFNAEPTKAHVALARIALAKNVLIFTENIDYLHERSGIMPVRPTKQTVLNNIEPNDLKQLDAIICIGLSRDDKGFLAYYKMHHPKGMIVAIDLSLPSYLSEDDCFLGGDLQKIVPNTVEELVE